MFRGMRRLFGQGLTPNDMQMLTQANRLYVNGQPKQAAPLFASLAQTMEATQHPRRAANLHAQASHAYADTNDSAQALFHARAALSLFASNQMVERLPRFYNNITNKMRQHGMNGPAEQLMQEFGSQITKISIPENSSIPTKTQAKLPTSCPKCGAPVHSSEVNWLDSSSAECDYCGTVLQAT